MQAEKLFQAADLNANGMLGCNEFRRAFTQDVSGADTPRTAPSTSPLRTGKRQHPGRDSSKQMWKFLHVDEQVRFGDMDNAGKQEYRDRARIQAVIRKNPAMKHAFRVREERGAGHVTHTRVPLSLAANQLRKNGVNVSDARMAELYAGAADQNGNITFSELAAHTDDFFQRMQVGKEQRKHGRRRVCITVSLSCLTLVCTTDACVVSVCFPTVLPDIQPGLPALGAKLPPQES